MQINGYRNALYSYNLRTQSTARTNETFKLQEVEDTKELTEVEEMEIFKKEIYKELSDIDKMTSPKELSNSVHITESAFKRMKEDPEYRSKIMNILREDARVSFQLPFQIHTTTTIDENGYSSYGAAVYPHDSAETRSNKRSEANKKAEGAFYHSSSYDSKFSQNQKMLDKIWLKNKKEQDILSRINEERNLLKQSQAKKILMDKMYLSEHIQGFDSKALYIKNI